MIIIGKIKVFIKVIIEKNNNINNIIRQFYNYFRKIIYIILFWINKVDENIVFFESYTGRSVSCSPKRILEIMLNNDSFVNKKLIVSVRDINKYDYSKYKNVVIVKYNSYDYYKYLSKTKYIFTNSRLIKCFEKKKKQIYIQLWHGTPLKRIGADIISNGKNGQESINKTIKSYKEEGKRIDYFISPSKFASDKFIKSFCLDILNKEKVILEIGYPRNDILINATNKHVEDIKLKYHIPENKKIILYAPTWRDNEYTSKDGYIQNIKMDLNNFKDKLEDEYIILFRLHYFVSDNIDLSKWDGFAFDVSNIDDINDLYLISDILITDYSSVFFDYAILNRPIIFYMYDLKEYSKNIRGLYLELNELPGKVIESENDLLYEIVNLNYDYNKLKEFNNKFNYLEDGKAGNRLVDYIFD